MNCKALNKKEKYLKKVIKVKNIDELDLLTIDFPVHSGEYIQVYGSK